MTNGDYGVVPPSYAVLRQGLVSHRRQETLRQVFDRVAAAERGVAAHLGHLGQGRPAGCAVLNETS